MYALNLWIYVFFIKLTFIYSAQFGSSEEIVLVNQAVPITFSYPSSVLRFQPWNFQKYFKLDIRFSTREHRGILFFVGSSTSTHDCIGIDIFNSNLNVYGILNGKEFRIQMNPIDTTVSNGKFYNVAIQILPGGYLTMSFNGIQNPNSILSPRVLEFDTYTYIGGVDSVFRLPWIAYAQIGFAGCMEYLRVNDDKFIDTNKFAKQTEMQGVKTGIAETTVARCVPGLCGPGKCQERTYNLKDSSKNFYCDCSGTMKSYSSIATDILRGETCIRDSTLFQCDKKTFLSYDFDTEQVTHSDDISIDFRTTSKNEPLFLAKRKHGDFLSTFISAEVFNGQVFVGIKLQDLKDDKYNKVFIPNINGLNDGQWHTLKITRYVQEVSVYVDDESNVMKGKLYRSSDGEKFYNKIREIYIGSKTKKPGSDKCSGTLKNFYWNEFDLLNTRNYLSRYQSQVISEKPQLPVLPPFPRLPPIPCTIKSNHQRTVIPNVALFSMNSLFMIELRTKYDGVVLHAEIPNQIDEYLTVLITGNSIIVPFHLGQVKGVIEIELTRGGLNIRDDSWHRIIVELSTIKSSITVFVDDIQEITKEVIFQNSLGNIKELTFSIGGFSEDIQYYKVLAKFKEYLPNMINSFSNIEDTKFVGCVGEFLTNTDSFSKNLLFQSNVNHYPKNSVFCRACHEVIKCPKNFCQNNGRCYNINENSVTCNCTGTNFHGSSCDIKNPTCSINDCLNGGTCSIIGSMKACNCAGTGYTGEKCEISQCYNVFCKNNGVCRLINGYPRCDCSGTTFSGTYCDQAQCPNDFCKNRGQCKLDNLTGLPFCDCKGTGNTGVRCDKPVCTPGQCSFNGNCVTRDDKPNCYCYDDYLGNNCETPVCPKDYCFNSGRCTPLLKTPMCICSNDFEGARCEKPKLCPEGSCLYGGSCTMLNGRPICNCTNTDYLGTRCEKPKSCPSNYCQNGGRCSVMKNNFVCDCSNTAYSGSLCNNKLGCPNDYCLNGGLCSNENGKFVCDCSQTGYSGDKCDQKSKGLQCPYKTAGYSVKMFKPPKITDGMTTTMGFQTWVPSGTIFCYQTFDDKYWSVKLISGKVVIDINGINFQMKTKVNDGKYHVIKITRDARIFLVSLDVPEAEVLTIPVHVTNILSLPDNLIAYTKLILCNSCPDTEVENQFQGSIGGAKSGNDSIADQINSNSVAVIGSLSNILVPMTPLPRPILTDSCSSGFCKNGGKCYMKNYFPTCDCGISGYEGEKCDRKIFIIKSIQPNPGFIIQNIIPAIPKQFIIWKFLANFLSPNSPIATFILSDGNYLEFKYVNGKIELGVNGIHKGFLNSFNLNQNVSNFFKIQNTLGRLTMYVNKTKTGAITLPDDLLMTNGSINVVRILVGANKNLDQTLKGFIGGYNFNKDELLLPNGTFSPTATNVNNILIKPWRVIAKKILLPPEEALGSHGGIVYANGILIFPYGYGVGAIVPAGSGPVILGRIISMAGGVLPISAMGLGCLIVILLLISAIIWAICYLGLIKYNGSKSLFGISAFYANANVNVATMPLLTSGTTTTQMIERNGSMLKTGYDTDFESTVHKGLRLDLNKTNNAFLSIGSRNMVNEGYTFGGGKSGLGSASRINVSHNYLTVPNNMSENINAYKVMQVDAANESLRSGNAFLQANYGLETAMNAFNDEDIKVESCILSDDSKFAATGSVLGPPQIWDMSTGDMIKIMYGGDFTYSSLHLAVQSSLLVGLAVENQQHLNRKKLTIWDFHTGEEIYFNEQYFCSICCISADTFNCIMADETEQSAITILKLTDGKSRKLFYNQPEILFDEGIQLLKISNNNQYIVAGCRKALSMSCYMIFDITKDVIKEPKVIDIRSLIQSCSFINNLEIVIGTDSGELIVWNLEAAVPKRQLLISASFDNGIEGVLKPHENKINCITVSKDGSLMVTGGSDSRVRVWNMEDETLLQSITKHDDEIQSVALSNDNEILVTGSWDGSIRTWDLRNGREMCCFVSSIEITKVLISNDKSVVVALGEKAGVNKLVMMKIVRNISTVVKNNPGQMRNKNMSLSMVSPPL